MNINKRNNILRYLNEKNAFEGPFTILFNRLARESTTIIDIGASAGYYTRIAALRMKTGKIYAYEPEPDRFEILNETVDNILQNNDSKIEIIPRKIALSNKIGKGGFKINPTGSISGKLINNNKLFQVEINTLDNLHLNEKVDIIKIDVEGEEYNVLLGGRKLLENQHPDIFVEYHGGIREKVKKFLINLGYSELNWGGKAYFTKYEAIV